MTTEQDAATSVAKPGLEAAAEAADRRRGLLLALPAYVYLLLFFILPFLIVFVYSFATRSATGATRLTDWNVLAYQKLFDSLVVQIVWRSFWIASLTTIICLVLAYPFAYYIATRRPAVRNVLLVLVMIPFWSNFLIRTYAWRFILGTDGPIATLTDALGMEPVRLLFTNTAVMIGLVYGFLPFMVLPLYASIERLDWSLVEAARDLYANGWSAFRRVTLPLTRSGIIAGSLLVFVPSFGAYVTPAILGGSKDLLLGSYIVTQFQQARNWPFGSALSIVVMVLMLAALMIRARTGAEEV